MSNNSAGIVFDPTNEAVSLIQAARHYNRVKAEYDATFSRWEKGGGIAAYEEYKVMGPVMEAARVALDDAVKAVGV